MKPSTPGQISGSFIGLGLALGWCFPVLFADWIFYTTKPFHFLDDRMVLILGVVFAFSAATIPFLAALVQRSAADISYRRSLLRCSCIWIAGAAGSSLAVSLLAATIHHQAKSIPEWLVPSGLYFIPVTAGIVNLYLGLRRVRRAANHRMIGKG